MRWFHALLLLLASLTLAGAPGAAQTLEHARVGLLSLHKPEIERAGNIGASALRAGMQALGYIDGRNFELHEPHADGEAARLASLADELVAERVNIIVTFGTDATHAARQVTPPSRS